MACTEQITFLLILKMADEQTRSPYSRKPIVPNELGWASLLKREGEELERHYRKILDELGRKSGMLGAIFKKARQDIQNPATLRRLIVELIDTESWTSMQADVKRDIYEGMLERSAKESPKGAGQYFTPRELIKAIVDCVQPTHVAVPPLDEQVQIAKEVDRQLTVIEVTNNQLELRLQSANRLRQSILKRAFEGTLVGKLGPKQQG